MTWKFDNNVSSIFPTHARTHIPNYEEVIKKTIDVCATRSKSSKIIDVGCAVGETLLSLHNNGFKNLHGVDNSQSMLDMCPKNIASYYNSETLPDDRYDIVIANWTLHFVKDKTQYLEKIYSSLTDNGILILSEKTSNTDFAKKLYYQYKKEHGATEEEIIEKERNLQGVMFINSPEWYLNTLKNIGFDDVQIFDANWCFTSFACFK